MLYQLSYFRIFRFSNRCFPIASAKVAIILKLPNYWSFFLAKKLKIFFSAMYRNRSYTPLKGYKHNDFQAYNFHHILSSPSKQKKIKKCCQITSAALNMGIFRQTERLSTCGRDSLRMQKYGILPVRHCNATTQ